MKSRRKLIEGRIASRSFVSAKRILKLKGSPSKVTVAKMASELMGAESPSKNVTIVGFVEWHRAGRVPHPLTAADVANLHALAASEERQVVKAANKKKKNAARKVPAPKLSASAKAKFGITPIGDPHPDYTDSKAFYASDAWKRARYATLVYAGGRCACCGARPADGVILHVDHIVPRWKDPSLQLEPSNLQVLCSNCNVGKGAWDSTDWR